MANSGEGSVQRIDSEVLERLARVARWFPGRVVSVAECLTATWRGTVAEVGCVLRIDGVCANELLAEQAADRGGA